MEHRPPGAGTGETGPEPRSGPLQLSPLTALRRDPSHVAEINALYGLGALARRLRASSHPPSSRHTGRPDGGLEERARQVVRRATARARRAGAATGTSFVVGMPAALATIYLSQLRMVLDVAALFGRDPTEPVRAAEFLVLQGRYPTVDAAAAVLARVPYPKGPQGIGEAIVSLIRQIPSLISVQWDKFRGAGAVNAVLTALGLASFVVPFLGVPVCAAGSARATRKLGRAAIDFYGSPPTDDAPVAVFALPAPPSRSRTLTNAVIAAVVLIVAAAATVHWIGGQHHGIKRILLAVVWLWVGYAYARLFALLYPETRKKTQPSP